MSLEQLAQVLFLKELERDFVSGKAFVQRVRWGMGKEFLSL